MKALKGIFLLFIVDWIIAFFLSITRILALVWNLVQDLFPSPAMPLGSIFVNILLIVLIDYILNQRFIKASKKIFIISQGLFGVSLLAILYIALSAWEPGMGIN